MKYLGNSSDGLFATHDKLEDVLKPGYFNSFGRLASLGAYRPVGLHEAVMGAYRPVGLHESVMGAYRPVGLHEAVGDLVYVGTTPRPKGSPWITQHQNNEIRRALLMAKGRGEDGILRMRLVQDYGRPDDPDAALLVAKKSPGRPAKKAPSTGQAA